MRVVGLDIGGANLKASDGERLSVSRPFPLWRRPDRLANELADLLKNFAAPDLLAVTMTGELADCFATKADGVQTILRAVRSAAGSGDVVVWQTGGEFCSTDEALDLVPLVAAANWHALASWAARTNPVGTALLIDVGSTTCDVVPLADGLAVPAGRTDRERLVSQELIYTGVRRTPLCALVDSVPVRGVDCPVAAELFATTLDVYLLLGELPERPDDRDTANGGPATREAAVGRMLRMVCCDRDGLSPSDAVSMAAHCRDVQTARIREALSAVMARLPSMPAAVILSGEGEFLSRRALCSAGDAAFEVVSLREVLGGAHSDAACAYALARLCREK